jgi:hypothetical protein
MRTNDALTQVAQWEPLGAVTRLQQAIRAKQDRQKWIDENLIQPRLAAGVKVDRKHVIQHARLVDEIDNLTRELDGLGAPTEALARATDLLRALGGRLDQAIPIMNAHGQAMVYSALLTVAYVGGAGRGRGKTNSIRSFQTVAESRVYSQDWHNPGLKSKM